MSDARLIFVDVTDLLDHFARNPAVTGIQRVVIGVVKGLIEKDGAGSIALLRDDPAHGRIVSTRQREALASFARFEADDFVRTFGLPRAANKLKKKYLRFEGAVGKARPLSMLRLHARRLAAKARARFAAALAPKRAASGLIEWTAAEVGRHDVVLALGAVWDRPAYLSRLEGLRRSTDCRMIIMIHDMIPLLMPEHVSTDTRDAYERFVRQVAGFADRLIANSRSTAHDLEHWLRGHGLRTPPMATIPLAQEAVLPTSSSASAPEPTDLEAGRRFPAFATPRAAEAASSPYAFVLGTIESRKNLVRLLRVWRRLAERHGASTPRLILGGKIGYGADAVFALLDETRGLGGLARFIHRPTEREVVYLMANCLFSVCVSLYEGWGLPVGESMSLGRPVVASRVSSLPEVGDGLADFCDPSDDADIEAALERMAFDAVHRRTREREIASARLRTWASVVDDIAAEVRRP